MFAIVEFGSLKRNEEDSYSDRDLLVVCPIELRKKYLCRFEKEGYSVSFFSDKQLSFMKKKGSLFLQHLKLESKVIFDSNLEFSSFIETCEFVKPSFEEVNICTRSIEYLSSIPDIPLLRAWKADFLFCLSRDFLIKRLAQEEKIVFGLKDIRTQLKDVFSINLDRSDDFSNLRKVKAAYRSDLTIPDNIEHSICNWFNTLNDNFGFNIYDNSLSEKNFTFIAKREFQTVYEQLRSLEALYLIARSIGFIHPKHDVLMNYIQKPNFYRSTQKFNETYIKQFIYEISAVISNASVCNTSIPLRCASLNLENR